LNIWIRDDYENSCAYDWRVAKKDEITRKFMLVYPKFDGYLIIMVLVIG